MLVLLLIPILAEAGYPQKQNQGKARRPKSFTFMTNQNKEFTLKKNSLKTRDNFLHRLSKRIRGSEKEYEGWYYLHVLEDNFAEVLKVVPLSTENAILRDTFIAYLTEEQVYKLENITLFKQLSSEDKFTEDGGSIENTNYFHVITKRGISVPENTELYKIESQSEDNTYVIFVDPKGLNQKEIHNKKKKAVEYLSSLRFVKSVSTFTRPTIKNAVFTGYTQQNSRNILTNSSNNIKYLPRYVNNQGITGKGQIVTIQDTPIDIYHAMFRDDNVQVQLNKQMTNHRKFVYYGSKSKTLSDWSSKLEVNEHGTHVAGTTAGNSICTNDLYIGATLFNGNAPDAKILYAGDLNDVSSSKLGELMRQYNSYISTNSWGVNGYNDQYNFEYGKLAYDNPERLFLFAAGNEYSDGNFTVCDPGGSKNVLTVGSMGDFFNIRHYYEISSSYNINNKITAQALLDADPWTTGTLGSTSNYDIVAIDPSNGNQCNLINSGKISLLYAPDPNDQSMQWIYSCQLESTSGILYTSEVTKVRNMIGQNVNCIDVTKINASQGITHADYSSGGPGNKGILKPDIMTPGTRIISAKSKPNNRENHGCQTTGGGDFTYMQGTSMATPNAAGATALVREYFKKNIPWNVDLDGTTLRALMINSCKHPHNSKTPDVLFGHGIVDLSTILPFDDSFGVQMTKPGQLPSIKERSSLSAQFSVSSSSNIKVQITLSYLDAMLNANSAIPLARDLDLVVIGPNKEIYYGDHLSNGDTQHFSTNEKVIIDNPITGTYTIYVISDEFTDSGVGSDSQQFSVVVSGPGITNGFLTFSGPKTCPCKVCRTDDQTKCQCDNTSIGNLCQAKIEVVHGNKKTVTVKAMQVMRVLFIQDKDIKIIKSKSSSPGKQSTIWYSNECHANIGDYDKSGSTGSLMNKETKVNPSMKTICVAISNINYRDATYEIEVSEKSSTTTIIIVVVVVVVAIVVIAIIVYCLYKKGKCSKLPVGGS